MITYDLSNMKSLRAIVNVDISHEQPVGMEVEGKESGNSIEIPAQILVKGFIDGFVLDQQTGTLTRPDFNTVVRIDWQIGDLISKALGAVQRKNGAKCPPNLELAGNLESLHQPRLLHGGADEGGEERVRLEGPGFQLWVELHADEPGMVGDLDDLRQEPVRR